MLGILGEDCRGDRRTGEDRKRMLEDWKRTGRGLEEGWKRRLE